MDLDRLKHRWILWPLVPWDLKRSCWIISQSYSTSKRNAKVENIIPSLLLFDPETKMPHPLPDRVCLALLCALGACLGQWKRWLTSIMSATMIRSWSTCYSLLPVHKKNRCTFRHGKRMPHHQNAVPGPRPPHRHGAVRPPHRRDALSGQCVFKLFDQVGHTIL